jgi:hypothetical protein
VIGETAGPAIAEAAQRAPALNVREEQRDGARRQLHFGKSLTPAIGLARPVYSVTSSFRPLGPDRHLRCLENAPEVAVRRGVRVILKGAGVGPEIEAAVSKLLG